MVGRWDSKDLQGKPEPLPWPSTALLASFESEAKLCDCISGPRDTVSNWDIIKNNPAKPREMVEQSAAVQRLNRHCWHQKTPRQQGLFPRTTSQLQGWLPCPGKVPSTAPKKPSFQPFPSWPVMPCHRLTGHSGFCEHVRPGWAMAGGIIGYPLGKPHIAR